jgi:hypothetical protein
MRAVWITKSGGPEVLAVRESADPKVEESGPKGEHRLAFIVEDGTTW